MFVELNRDGLFVGYFNNRADVLSENQTTIIQITGELYELLKLKMPWQLTNFDVSKTYDVVDADLFVEILPTVQISDKERIEQLEQENILLKAQKQALSEQVDFHEELFVELAMKIYE